MLTTGGTGLAPRDVTPEATRDGARPRGARDRRGDPRRLDREDAARAALPRRRRRRAARRSSSTCPARPAAAATASPCCSPRSRMRSSCSPASRATSAAHGRRERRRAVIAPAPLRVARQARAHGLRAAVRLRRRAPRRRRRSPSAHDLLWITVAMVGARTLAMALNRLIDAEIDARNPRTASRELPARRAVARAGARASALARSRSSSSPSSSSTRSCAGSGRSRSRLRRLPVPQARHLALPPLARRGRRARAGRRLGRDHAASCRGRRGRSAARSRSGSPASTSSTRSSTSSIDRAQGLHSWATRFGERGVFAGARVFHVATVAFLAAGRRSASTSACSTGSASPRSRRCSPTSTRSSGPATCAASTPRSSR